MGACCGSGKGAAAKRSDDLQPFLKGDSIQNAALLHDERSTMCNFILMCVCFGINHGTVTALVGLSSSVYECDPNLARAQNGVMWTVYAVVALLFSAATTKTLGPKYTLALGLVLNLAYVTSFLIAKLALAPPAACSVPEPQITTNLRWGTILLASVMSGVGAGLLWTAQGAYFQLTAKIYTQQSGTPLESATSMLATIFSGIYLGSELALKLCTSLLPLKDNETMTFAVLSTIATVAAFSMFLVQNISMATEVGFVASFLSSAQDTWSMLRGNPDIWRLAPFNIAFGLAIAYLNYDINKGLISDAPPGRGLGIQSVGYAQTILVAAAICSSSCFGFLNHTLGKLLPMMTAGLCWCVWALIILILGFKELQFWSWVIPLYIIFGFGRGVYESTNKALFVDLFGSQTPVAFGLLSLQVGLGAGTGFAMGTFARNSDALGICTVALGALGIIGIWHTTSKSTSSGE